MGITWSPISPFPGVSGSASCETGSTQGEWLSCAKDEQIFGEVSSTHTNGHGCTVTHTCAPPIPSGVTISNTATGIIVSGLTNSLLDTPLDISYTLKQSHLPNQGVTTVETDPLIPPNSILSHYPPLQRESELYVITVTATWYHDTGDVTPYVLNWPVRIYNNWIGEKNTVINIVQGQT